jgi:hypothetical protein
VVVLCDATNSICRWVIITTLVQNRQYHLTQGEAPPHVEERETPNRDMLPSPLLRMVSNFFFVSGSALQPELRFAGLTYGQSIKRCVSPHRQLMFQSLSVP